MPCAYYPIWRRPVAKDHLHAQNRNLANAGFPDFVLTTNQRRTDRTSAAIMEIKTFWSYPWGSIVDIFSELIAEFYTGRVQFGFAQGFSTPQRILKQVGLFAIVSVCQTLLIATIIQVWGEMIFFTCDWAMWTNREHVIFMAKTGAVELTCSRPISWSDPFVLWAILGFTLASIDAKMDHGLMPQIVGQVHSQWPDPEDLVQPLHP